MSSPARGPRRAVTRYEIVVRGELAAAVRLELRPTVTASCEVQTVLRARMNKGRDLSDLVSALRARGLEVVSVTALA